MGWVGIGKHFLVEEEKMRLVLWLHQIAGDYAMETKLRSFL
jgi:hypothetical protein